MTNTVRLYSKDLLSKWGFSDGDVLDDLLWDRADDEDIRDDGDEHAVLVRAVREYLLPVLEQDVEVYEIDTIHNPIRAATVNGVEIDDYNGTPGMTLTPEYVDVPFDVLWLWYCETMTGNLLPPSARDNASQPSA